MSTMFSAYRGANGNANSGNDDRHPGFTPALRQNRQEEKKCDYAHVFMSISAVANGVTNRNEYSPRAFSM